MVEKEIAAGVVLYNPNNIDRVLQCLESLRHQVNQIYIFDNCTQVTKIPMLNYTKYISGNGNRGLAYALNRIMEQAQKDGYDWVLTMDQDSVLPEGMIEDFKQYMCNEQVAIICPQVVDKRRTYMEVTREDVVDYLDMCITSASCTSVAAWKKIGKFDEWLFIDLIDNEFCKRLKASGYEILQIKKWVLDQEFGKIVPKSREKQEFWIKVSKILHNENFAKFSYKKTVSSVRVYYTCRNIIYVNRKMSLYGKTGYENYNCKGYAGFVISFIVPSVFRAEKKGKVLAAAWNGTRDGLAKRVEPWRAIKG